MGELRKSDSKQSIDQLIISFFTKKFDAKNAEIYFEVVHSQTNDFHVKHSSLSEYVYTHFDKVKRLEDGSTTELYWVENVEVLRNYLKENMSKFKKEDIKEISELPNRIYESIDLAIIQYKYFFDKLSEANQKLNDVNKKYKKSSKRFSKAAARFEMSSKKLDNSTSEFISMLGIFSALIFAVFGGFDSLKSIFTNINKVSVSTVIINSSLLMIGLIILIFLLIQSISILSEKTFLACGCENISKCSHKFYERYPIFSFSIGLFLVTLLLGLLCRENIKLPLNLKLETVLSFLGLIIILMIPIYLIYKNIFKNIFKKISNLFTRFFKKISNLFTRFFKKVEHYLKPF